MKLLQDMMNADEWSRDVRKCSRENDDMKYVTRSHGLDTVPAEERSPPSANPGALHSAINDHSADTSPDETTAPDMSEQRQSSSLGTACKTAPLSD
ncbi:MAG: hypothetical protein JSU90_10095, partial [Nitrospiraceae bacterium]